MDWSDWGLIGVMLSAFTSATILPGTSEAALVSYVATYPHALWIAFVGATLANTLGSLTSFFLGRCFHPPQKIPNHVLVWLQHWGPASLFLAWVPILGDALPLAAGAMRCPWLSSALFLCLGKGARYAALLGLLSWWQA